MRSSGAKPINANKQEEFRCAQTILRLLVFHHPDGRMAKIKLRDFGIKRAETAADN
jgi:hypothetical protein